MAQRQQQSMEKRQSMTPEDAKKSRLMAMVRFMNGRKDEIQKLMPPGVSVDRFVKTAMIAAAEGRDIDECTPLSVYRSVLQACLMGLTVGNGMNEAYLIKYYDKKTKTSQCSLRVSYLGWIKVAVRHDKIDSIRASVIYSNDVFVMQEHPPKLEHSPRWVDGQRGEAIGSVAVAYTLAQTEDGRTVHCLFDFAFASMQDLEKARSLNSESAAWKIWWDEMAKKVPVRRLAKWLPKDDQMDRLMRIENNADAGVVGVPDPDIDDQATIIDSRFEEPEAEPPAALPPAQPKTKPAKAPAKSRAKAAAKPAPAKADDKPKSRSQQLRGQIVTTTPKPPANGGEADYGTAPGEPPPPNEPPTGKVEF